MSKRVALRRKAQRWVRRNRPGITATLPRLVERYVLQPMAASASGGDLTYCPYYQGRGTCAGGCWEEPSCITDEPLRGWPRARMARGWVR